MIEPFNSIRENLYQNVRSALMKYHEITPDESPLAHLQLYQNELRKRQSTARRATNEILSHLLRELEKTYKIEAQIIQMRFLDGQETGHIADELGFVPSTVSNKQSAGIKKLTEILWEMETEARAAHRAMLEERLEPPSYYNLIGIQTAIDTLIALLEKSDSPWIIAVEGMGGIGKTSLADALIRQMLDEEKLSQFGWITARQQKLLLDGSIRWVDKPAITAHGLIEALATQLLDNSDSIRSMPISELKTRVQRHLKETPHVIVIDNLETVTDVDDLMIIIRELMNPTKFILTSRLFHYADPDIYHFPVSELDSSNALCLIRQEAGQRDLSFVLEATDADLLPIIEAVGGNPLALRLIVGQMILYPLDNILYNLRNAHGKTIENFYTFIYEQTWAQLDEMERAVLIVMILVTPHGMTGAELAEIIQMESPIVFEKLAKLVTLNLIDSYGDIHQRVYTIHNLTRTFLCEKVAL